MSYIHPSALPLLLQLPMRTNKKMMWVVCKMLWIDILVKDPYLKIKGFDFHSPKRSSFITITPYKNKSLMTWVPWQMPQCVMLVKNPCHR